MRGWKESKLDKDATVAKFATVVNRGIRGSVEDELEYQAADSHFFHTKK